MAASGPTVESTVSRIENLRGSIIPGKGNGDKRSRCAGYLDRKLSTQEEAQLLGTAVMGSSAAAGDAEGEEEQLAMQRARKRARKRATKRARKRARKRIRVSWECLGG